MGFSSLLSFLRPPSPISTCTWNIWELLFEWFTWYELALTKLFQYLYQEFNIFTTVLDLHVLRRIFRLIRWSEFGFPILFIYFSFVISWRVSPIEWLRRSAFDIFLSILPLCQKLQIDNCSTTFLINIRFWETILKQNILRTWNDNTEQLVWFLIS
jgi:hypothetical protein